jgi:hypothetical protein
MILSKPLAYFSFTFELKKGKFLAQGKEWSEGSFGIFFFLILFGSTI